MKHTITSILALLMILTTGCNIQKKANEDIRQIESVFPKGEILSSDNFTGTVWLHMMGAEESTLYARFGNVSFEAGARTNWHSHPGGQVLFITEGRGYYQAKGQPARSLQAGDVVEIPREVVHWHGAAPDSEFAHIAISLNTDEGGAIWSGPVKDEEYASLGN